MADLKAKQIKFPLTGTNVVSSSAQIATNISGSFTAASSSFSTRVTTAESELGNTLISSSAQISADISGSFTAASSSFSTRVTTAESELTNTLVSSSAQIASDISGSFTAASSSISTRLTTAESELGNTLISSSAQISTDISGSFTAPSASISTRLTTAESELGNTLISSSAQIASDISGSLRGELSGSHIKFVGGGVSGSITSTASFGRVEVGTGGIDTAGDLTLDGDGGDIILKDGGTEFGRLTQLLGGLTLKSGPSASNAVIIGVDSNPNIILSGELQTSRNITGSSVTTGSFGKVFVGEMSNQDVTSVSSSISTRISTQEASSSILTSRNLIAGDGLTGGGTLVDDRTFAVNSSVLRTTGDNIISGSAQITGFGFISGSLSGTLSSSAQIASDISGSFTTPSASFSTRITTAESELTNTLISSSAQIASNISGSFTTPSASFSTRITTAESELTNTLISSSAQIASNISGSFTTPSASFSTRITTEEGNIDTLQARDLIAGAGLTGGGTLASDRTFAVGQGTGITVNANDIAIGQDVATTANVTFATITTTGDIESQGDIIAQNYIVSSSVTHMTSSFRSGSTISGDTQDDTHQFTGSLNITGSVSALTYSGIFEGALSSSAQIASNISGSFTNLSSSLSGRIGATEAGEITGITAGTGLSGGGSSGAVTLNVDFTDSTLKSNISGSFTSVSSSLSTRLSTAETELGNTLISSSAQLASDISGSFTPASASFSTRITTEEGNIDTLQGRTLTAGDGLSGGGTLASDRSFAVDSTVLRTTGDNVVSSSAQIASNISGSFTPASASFSTRVTTAESELNNTLFSGSAQVDHDSTTNFVANEHIDHTGVSITAGDGLTGGGTIAANRTLNVVGGTGITANANDIATNDSEIVHDDLSGFVANEHIDHTSVTLTAGDGLTGGGTIASNRTFAVGQGTGVTVNANDVAIGQAVETDSNVTFANIVATATGSFGKISGSLLESTGDFTLDSSGDIILDADGTDIILKDGGTEFGRFKIATSDFVIKSEINNKDILFKGQDGGSTITALQLDMSEGGNAQFLKNISGSQIEASGDVIAFGSSDERLKDNIQPISEPLWKVNQIGGYTFDWNDKQDTFEGHDVGVVAQEIHKVLPEVVAERDNGYLGVKYEKIVPLLIESIKELNKKIEHIEKNCDCLNK